MLPQIVQLHAIRCNNNRPPKRFGFLAFFFLLPLSYRSPSRVALKWLASPFSVYISTDTQFMIRLGATIVHCIGAAVAACIALAWGRFIRELDWNSAGVKPEHRKALTIYGKHLPIGAKNLLYKPSVWLLLPRAKMINGLLQIPVCRC